LEIECESKRRWRIGALFSHLALECISVL
jgi:hypothetical protein